MARCPIGECSAVTREPELLCKRHWFQVPAELRRLIWRLFKSEPGSFAHRKACFDAIEKVNGLQKPVQGQLL